MLFNSWEFFLFFPTVTALYFLLPHRFRWQLLLTASCLFYMSFVPKYIFILFTTIVVDYVAGLYIERSVGHRRKVWLWSSIFVTGAILFTFKYFNFFNSNVAELAKLLHWNYSIASLSLLLPIGLSFHTFQSLSYVIEVYRGNQKAERHFGIYSLYVMFYPQLVAGPIERPQNLLHEFHERHDFDYRNATRGLKLMAWGFFKKVVVADRINILIKPVFEAPHSYSGLVVLGAVLFFTFQIYCDFSGYSDIALGSAQVMGFRLMRNFDRPYSSTSLAEFWKRWHISLSTWLRDYIFTPLSIEWRYWGKWGVFLALLLTFTFSGLWHGAAWTFMIWGVFHGLGLGIESLLQPSRKKLAKKMNPRLFAWSMWALTFGFVSFSYIFFRASSLPLAMQFLSRLPLAYRDIGMRDEWKKFFIAYEKHSVLIVLVSLVAIDLVERAYAKTSVGEAFEGRAWWIRWPSYYALVAALICLGVWFGQREFIYFQF